MLLPDRVATLVPTWNLGRAVGGALAALALCVAAHAVPPTPAADAIARLVAEKEKGADKPATAAAPEAVSPLAAQDPAFPAPVAEAPKPPGLAEKFRNSTSSMVISAMTFLGVPYTRGGTSAEEGFDCSGFTRFIFESTIGLVLPRRADDQATAPGLLKVAREDLQPGDLVFFNTLRRTFSHVGIYVGEDKFIHAPRTGGNVRVENMRISYWAKRFTGARRAHGVDVRPQPAAPVVAAKPAATPPSVTSSLLPTEGIWY